MQRYKVAIKANSGISAAMRKYCEDCGISVYKFLATTIADRLHKPLDFSIAEIEDMQSRTHEKNSEFEIFEFRISDTIIQEKLRIIKEECGISLSRFFVHVIAEKLKESGYTFDDKSLRNPVRKNVSKQKPKSYAEKYAEDIELLRKKLLRISMQKL